MKNIINLISMVIVSLMITGCATHAQTAALAGAVAGVIVVNGLQTPRHHYHGTRRPMHCYSVNELVGYTAWGRPIFQIRHICR